jgi:hypothetical protein
LSAILVTENVRRWPLREFALWPHGDAALLRALGLDGAARSAREVWRALIERHLVSDPEAAAHRAAIEVLLEDGCLARRILRRVGEKPPREALAALYRELGECLREGRMLRAGA